MRVVAFVGAEGPEGEEEVADGDGEGDEVVGAPFVVVGDESCGYQGADGAADAVAAVESAEGHGGVCEVGAEDVVETETEGYSEAYEEERQHDHGERRSADEHDIGDDHETLRQHDHVGSAQPGLQGMGDRGSADEANGIGDENQGHNRIADMIVFLHVWNQSTRSAVIQAITKTHEAGAQETILVHRWIIQRLDNISGAVSCGRRRPAHLELVWGDWGLNSTWGVRCSGASGSLGSRGSIVTATPGKVIEFVGG